MAAGADFDQRRPMGVPQHQQVDVGVRGELPLSPRALFSRSGIDRWTLKAMFAKPGGEAVHQGEPDLRVQGSIKG